MNKAKKNDYQIPLDQAALWTTIWRAACPTSCKAFLIPVEDLIGTLKEMSVLREIKPGIFEYNEGIKRDVRAYMAIDPHVGEKGKKPEEKILLVGTEQTLKEGKIVYRDILNGRIDGELLEGYDGGDDGSGVFDFTEPCPDACDDDSPLIGG
jgi:hypothetical protein